MENPKNAGVSRFRFTIRGLLIATFAMAALMASCTYLNREFGYGHLRDIDDWPRALKSLVELNDEFKNDVTPFGLDGFIDHRSIWRIIPNSELRGALAKSHELIPTTSRHPKAEKLVDSIPFLWRIQINDEWNWYATPGYGSTHMEGVDLFLVVDNPRTGESIVLHEWLF